MPLRGFSKRLSSQKSDGPRAGVLVSLLAGLLLLATGGCGTESRSTVSNEVEYLPSEAMQRRANGQAEMSVIEPADGTQVSSPFQIEVAVDNYVMAPRGRSLDGEGHLHVMIDAPCIEAGEVIPGDAVHMHVGTGRSKILMDLEPGPHELCVQVGDGFHNAVAIVDHLRVDVR